MQRQTNVRRRVELAEVDWHSPQWIAIQRRRLLDSSRGIALDLSKIE